MLARLILILTITCNLTGCVGIQVVSAGLSAVGSYYSYQTSKKDPVEVTTISKDCYLYKYVSIPVPERESLSEETKRAIAINNKIMTENCGGLVVKPEISQDSPSVN